MSGELLYSKVDGFVKLISIFNDFYKKGYFNDKMLSASYSEAPELFGTGKAAMAIQGTWLIADILAKYPDAQMGIFPFPIVENAPLVSGHMQNFYIFKNSKNVDESKNLLEYISQPENMTKIGKDWGVIPSFKDVTYDLPAYIQEAKKNYLDKGMTLVFETGVMSRIPDGDLAKEIQNMWAGAGETPVQVLENWDKRAAELAKGKGLRK
jgi:raffinose/stachyose/melibiose transport system substrate-binding protein